MNRSNLGYFSFGDNLSDKVKIEYADSKNNTSLHTCAVCAAKISTLLCPDCGFDNSCNYELYPSLQKIDARTPSVSQLIEQRNSSAEPSVEKTIDFLKKQKWDDHVLSAVEEILTLAANGSFTEHHHIEIKTDADAKKATNNTYIPVQTVANEKKFNNLYIKNPIEKKLWEIVNENKKPSVEDSAAILNFGIKLLKDGNSFDGLRFIKFAANHGYDDAVLILGFCYDKGIGVPKDYKLATAYYNMAGIFGGLDETYKSRGFSDEANHAKACSAAEKIYNAVEVSQNSQSSALNITENLRDVYFYIDNKENKSRDPKADVQAVIYDKIRNKTIYIQSDKYQSREVLTSSWFLSKYYLVAKNADGCWYLNGELDRVFDVSINGTDMTGDYDHQLNNGDTITLKGNPKKFASEIAKGSFVYRIFTEGF